MLVSSLDVKIQGKLILSDINLELRKGINLILGPNGSGKTTLLRTIIGMIKPSKGFISIDEKIKSIGYSPAEFTPVDMRVIDVLQAGNNVRPLNVYKNVLKNIGMLNYLYRNFSTLSSGEKRLVLLAKALAEGDLVIMDEPTSNLDLRNQVIIMNIISKYRDEKDFIISTHDLEMLNIADTAYIIKNGRIIKGGNIDEILDENLLSEVYEVKIKKVFIEGRYVFLKQLF
ncbi:MAG: ABC transporter ATP-binding protein [Sulfolobaceae archaeon]|nr:ABC transporter ATP-binding protein [Sulfolobaceae archaeon]